MAFADSSTGVGKRLLFGFFAGFLAVWIFHQLTLLVLWNVGLAPFAPFSMAATKPFGVPATLSLAIWGGIWGHVVCAGRTPFSRDTELTG